MKNWSNKTWAIVFFGVIAFMFLSTIRIKADAKDNTNCAVIHILDKDELEQCKIEIQSDVDINKAKFNKTTEINAMYRELLESGEAESRSLNNANNANRTRMRAIDRRLASFTSPLPIEE